MSLLNLGGKIETIENMEPMGVGIPPLMPYGLEASAIDFNGNPGAPGITPAVKSNKGNPVRGQ